MKSASGFARSFIACLALATALCGLCGCASGPSLPHPVAEGATPPSYAEIAQRHNQRVNPLANVSSAVVTRLWFTDDEGKSRQEQMEGRLIVVPPRDVFMRFDKLGETYALLGSNDTQYWWIELGQTRHAWLGLHETHARAEPHASVEIPRDPVDFGLPVHPVDLVELLAITPLPRGDLPDAAVVGWSDDRRWIEVTVPAAAGFKRMTFDRRTFEPTRVELLGADGASLIAADLMSYVRVDIFGVRPRPRIAGEIEINLPEARVRIRLAEPATLTRPPRGETFDFERLITRYRVRDVTMIDDSPRSVVDEPVAAGVEP